MLERLLQHAKEAEHFVLAFVPIVITVNYVIRFAVGEVMKCWRRHGKNSA